MKKFVRFLLWVFFFATAVAFISDQYIFPVLTIPWVVKTAMILVFGIPFVLAGCGLAWFFKKLA